MTLLNGPRTILADSHALETPEVFDDLAERFGGDARLDYTTAQRVRLQAK